MRFKLFKKGASLLLSAVLVSAFCVPAGIASADTLSDDGSCVTVATTPASQPLPEIFGASLVEYSGKSFPDLDDWQGSNVLRFKIFGDSTMTSAADPYLYNVVNDPDGDSVRPALNSNGHNGCDNTVSRPGQALAKYEDGMDSGDKAVWDMLPDVIIGNNTSATTQVTYNEAEYGPAAAAANADNPKAANYKPVASSYYPFSSLRNILDNIYTFAKNCDQVVADSNGTKSLRYGSAIDIAKKYEVYVMGIRGYILEQLDEDKASKKSYFDIRGYDASTDTFTVALTPANNEWKSGTSTRWMEMCSTVATNAGDALKADSTHVVTEETSSAPATISGVTRAELGTADVLLVPAEGNNAADVTYEVLGTLAAKTYRATDNNIGVTYQCGSNNIEVTQNYARILGFMYPEYITQSEAIAYYYDNFYHLNSDKLASTIDRAMDGVRNAAATGSSAAALDDWTEDTVAGYDRISVENKYKEGCRYILANYSSFDANQKNLLEFTENVSSSDFEPTLTAQTIKLSVAKKTLKAGKSATFKVTGAKTNLVAKAANSKSKKALTVKASGKTKVKVTVKKKAKKGTYKVKVRAKATDTYKASAYKTITIKVK